MVSLAERRLKRGLGSRLARLAIRSGPAGSALPSRLIKIQMGLYRAFGRRSAAVELNGLTFRVSTADLWAFRRYFARCSLGKPRVLRRFRDLLGSDPASVFWDIGANYGVFSVQLADVAGAVIAVEPIADVHQLLRQNLAPFGSMVQSVNAAVSDRNGSGSIYVPPGFSGDGRIYRPEDEPDRRVEPVEFVTIDHLAKTVGVGLAGTIGMKLDVQGAETLAVLGAREVLGSARRALIMVEIWRKGLEDGGSSLSELAQAFLDCGYDDVEWNGRHLTWPQFCREIEAEEETLVVDVFLSRGL